MNEQNFQKMKQSNEIHKIIYDTLKKVFNDNLTPASIDNEIAEVLMCMEKITAIQEKMENLLKERQALYIKMETIQQAIKQRSQT